jgi:hypothetical protein
MVIREKSTDMPAVVSNNIASSSDWRRIVFAAAFIVRLVLVVFGEWQDRNFVVK